MRALANKLDITLDPVSSLPVKQTDGSTETRLEQWSAVNGVQFPRRISMIKDGATVAVIHVNKIELDRGLKVDELGKKPEDLKPVMSQRIPRATTFSNTTIQANSRQVVPVTWLSVLGFTGYRVYRDLTINS